MSKFKVGDKVRCIESNPMLYIELGEVYTVKQVIDNEYLILEEFHVDHKYCESRFELVETKQPTSYREMSPDSTIRVKIGDYEFDCPIKELLLVCKVSGSISGENKATTFWENIKDILQFELQLRHKLGFINIHFENLDEVYQEYFKHFYDKQNEKETLMKDIEEQKAILKNQQEFLKELEDKYNSL